MALKNLGCVFGALTSTGSTAVIASLVSGDATLTINGQSYTVTMSVAGNDRSEADDAGVIYAGYVGTQTVTGLSPFSVYSWTVTQGSSSTTGSFRTSPNTKASKFSLALGTCFAPNNNDQTSPNAFTFLKHYIKNHTDYPLLSILWNDDIFYADGYFGANAQYVNSQGKRFVTNNGDAGTRPEYDYSLNYLSWFGLLTPFYNESAPSALYMEAGLSDDFQYCISRTTFHPQNGDHEYSNNFGWLNGAVASVTPNALHATPGGFDGAGRNTYVQFMSPLHGTSAQSLDTNALHWYSDFGPVRYLSLDPITNAVYNADPALRVVYGSNQINDMLSIASSGSQWFTIVANPAVAGRGTPTYQASVTQYNYKDENYASVEYGQLWLDTGNTPPSLMDSSRTNGVLGTTLMVRGDWHAPVNLYWHAPADVGKSAESFMEIGLATVNSSQGSSQNLTGNTSLFESDNVTLLGSLSMNESLIKKPNTFTMTMLEVDGTKQTPEVILKQWDIEYNAYTGINQSEHFTNSVIERETDEYGNIWRVVMSKRLVLFTDNSGYNLEDEHWTIPTTSNGIKL